MSMIPCLHFVVHILDPDSCTSVCLTIVTLIRFKNLILTLKNNAGLCTFSEALHDAGPNLTAPDFIFAQ